LAARTDGSQIIQYKDSGPAENYLALGLHVGEAIKQQLPQDFFDESPTRTSAVK
jgi:hypothetical protein